MSMMTGIEVNDRRYVLLRTTGEEVRYRPCIRRGPDTNSRKTLRRLELRASDLAARDSQRSR